MQGFHKRHFISEKKLSGGLSQWRINALVFLFFIIIIVVAARLYALQVVAHEAYRELAEGQHSIFKKLVPKRGEIFLKDKNGLYPLAVNQETKLAYAVPKQVSDPQKTAELIAPILGLDENELKEKLNQPEDMYEVLKQRLSEEEIQKIKDLKLDGILFSDEDYRYYPSGSLASQVVGFVGWKENDFGGRYGVEAYFEKELKGEEGKVFQDRDAGGRWIPIGNKEVTPASDGANLVLSIDHIIQYESEKIIKGAVKKYEADSGSVIVMEPETGKILAMADYPNFNPNNYQEVEDISVFKNSSVSDTYEPGSVFKPITIAAGLDNGKINPETTYSDTGAVNEAGYTIQNSDYKAYGTQTMTQVLEKSLNTGVIFVEKLIGNKNFAEYVRRFGFGEKTGIDLLGEESGNDRNLNNLKSDIQFFTISFGQGIAMTPIQLITAYSAIANGGVLMKPQILDKIIWKDGEEEIIEPKSVRRVISEKASLETAKMLESVVVNGHGKRAGVPGYRVGGKTGTAQVASGNRKGYEEGINIGSFAGFAPIENPQFTVLVKIENPRTVEWAESSAAPAFGELMKFLLEYGNIPPTEEYTEADLQVFNQYHGLREFLTQREAEERQIIKEQEDKEKKDD